MEYLLEVKENKLKQLYIKLEENDIDYWIEEDCLVFFSEKDRDFANKQLDNATYW